MTTKMAKMVLEKALVDSVTQHLDQKGRAEISIVALRELYQFTKAGVVDCSRALFSDYCIKFDWESNVATVTADPPDNSPMVDPKALPESRLTEQKDYFRPLNPGEKKIMALLRKGSRCSRSALAKAGGIKEVSISAYLSHLSKRFKIRKTVYYKLEEQK